MRLVVIVVLELAALGGLGACSSCSTSAAPDAAVPRDAGFDAGDRDAGRDAGQRDAGYDAARADGGEAGWVPYSFLPVGCAVRRATNPRAFSPLFRWRPCFDGRVGCEELVSVDAGPTLGLTWGDPEADQTWFVLVRGTGRLGSRVEQYVADSSGECLAAWSMVLDARLCGVDVMGIGAGRVAVETSLAGDVPDKFRWLEGSVSVIGSATAAIATYALIGGVGSADQPAELTTALTAVNISPTGVGRISAASGFERIAPSPGRPGRFNGVAAFGRNIFYGDWGSTHVRHWLRTEDDRDVLFLSYDDSEVFRLSTDGRDLVWNRAFGWTPGTIAARVEIWTAAFTTDPAALAPRRVITLPRNSTGADLWHGWGYVAADGRNEVDGVSRGTEIWLVRLSDGAKWTLTAPAGYRWEPAWLGPTDFGMSVREYASGRGRTTFRIRYDSLGLPDA